MTAPDVNATGLPAQNITAEVRHFLSRRLIPRVVGGLGMRDVFFPSQSWKGYDFAVDSWHASYWKWVEDETPALTARRLTAALGDWSNLSTVEALNRVKAAGVDCSKVPITEAERKAWLDELFRQEYRQQVAVFRLAMRGPEAADSQTYDLFTRDFLIASEIGDDSYSKSLAKQKQRKPTKDKGDRRLKAQLLVSWIPGCLWAFTADGIAAFLQDHYPRSKDEPYHWRVIGRACRELSLLRAPKPLWWGVGGKPARLIPL